MNWDPRKPYQDLPSLPPSAEVETNVVLRRCISARAALAELKQAADLIQNPSILISTLPLLEAKASSEIEHIVTTTDKIFEHVNSETNADPATKEALRYSTALFDGFRELSHRPLSTRTAERICSKVKGFEMYVRRVPGTALTNHTTGEIIYTPPVGEDRLRELLANWERFIHSDTPLDPLVRLAVAHYQFEAIHPFTDGNGRTGRILNSLYLIEKGLLTLPVLYLSRYILERRADYNRLLLTVTRDASWEPWIVFMLDAVADTSEWTTGKIAAIRRLEEVTGAYIRAKLPKLYSHELVSLIFELPYCRIQNVVDRGIAKRQTASVYLRELTNIGVLIEQQASREKLFINPRLMKLLSDETNRIDNPPF